MQQRNLIDEEITRKNKLIKPEDDIFANIPKNLLIPPTRKRTMGFYEFFVLNKGGRIQQPKAPINT